MKNKIFYFIFIIGLILLNIDFSLGVCTLSLDQLNYSEGTTAVVTGSCSLGVEKSQSYWINWSNVTGIQVSPWYIEQDTGTTPATINTPFLETFLINDSFTSTYGSRINVTMHGTNLEGADSSGVSSAGSEDLIITDFVTSTNTSILVGNVLGLEFKVRDNNEREISGGMCTVSLEDGDDFPLIAKEVQPHDGHIHADFLLSTNSFTEGRNYVGKLYCYCGQANTTASCINEDGLQIHNAMGTGSDTFYIDKWLTVNTLVDREEYFMKNELFICANVTNVISPFRIPMHIFHQVRCSKGRDNNSDLDRSLIASDDDMPDERGISTATTQMQCKRFLIPEAKYLQGRSSECYASTTTWVLNDERSKIYSYATTSPVFNITSDELNIFPDWQRLSNYKFNSVVNLSTNPFIDYNGTGLGEIDIKINSAQSSLDSNKQTFVNKISIMDFIDIKHLKNYTVSNESTDLTSDTYLEFLEDGSVELEIRDVNLDFRGWYNITINYHDWEERDSSSLEGIENKTGSFAFSIDAKDTTTNIVTFDLSALLEIGTGEVEGYFSCYIDNYKSTTEIQFNNAINSTTAYTDTKTLNKPDGLIGIQKVHCDLAILSLGHDSQPAEDTFFASPYPVAESSGGVVPGEVDLIEDIKELAKNIAGATSEAIAAYWWGILVVGILGLLIFTTDSEERKGYKKKGIEKGKALKERIKEKGEELKDKLR